jgi:hypothetical protein
MKKTLAERILDADTKAGMYLGNANEAQEKGQYEKAEKLFEKSQYWLDRYNLLVGNADRPAPKL